jgi:hypothetical protein
MRILAFCLGLVTFFYACSPDLPPEVKQAYDHLPETIDFNRHIKPILSDRCFSCHGPDKNKIKAGLRLDLKESAWGELPESPGKYAIVPGSTSKSELVHRILSDDTDYMMPEPESHLTLTEREKAMLIKWIETGAVYKPHWAFIKPVFTKFPRIENESWIANPIDRFVLHRLEEEKLHPGKEADKETLLRRVSLDLTGLPPTKEEISSFIADRSANAYEKQVDRLLASPHYGERMAVDWLDVARYADSHGYTVDRIRDMSPWRDWVIKAFNQNLPYNDFITWQVAGDLLPSRTRDQLIATGFNRNHQSNMEGGIVEEEFRVEYVADRTNTTSEAFMAITAGCAKCHDHKFDPISQKEYYSMFSFFNNVKEAGQISWDDAMPVPTLLLTDKQKDSILAFIGSNEKAQQNKLADHRKIELPAAENWIAQRGYKTLLHNWPEGMISYFPLTNRSLKNAVKGSSDGSMHREGNAPDSAHFVAGNIGSALEFNGDSWLNTGKMHFRASDPFTIGLWVNIPGQLKKGVVFHQGSLHLTYGFRGFHLVVDGSRLILEMVHTAPYNAITEFSATDIPIDKWIYLAVTYDGSSKASGYKLFKDGKELPTIVDQDKLYKDILFTDHSIQPGIQFGAWERGKGLAGGKAHSIMIFNRELSSIELLRLFNAEAVAAISNKAPAELSSAEHLQLLEYYFSIVSAPQKTERKKLQSIRAAYLDSIESVKEIMVMEEMPVARKTFVLNRGLYNDPTVEVSPDVPKSILPMPKDLPRNRLGYAKWLTAPDHPLTARVAVNRYWQMYFGRGIVKTSEDFGNQGQMPSHPELLDWLALEFQRTGWNVKALQKLIVMSNTYRQSSIASPELQSKDPENVLLARGPALRLTAEMLRDNALLASGLLNKQIGGRSVNPYQPEGLWSINGAEYYQDSGNNLYRRGMYTIWKRSVPNPTQATFDVGIRSSCITRRQNTNTPLQALIMLNDPTFLEASKVLGESMTAAPNIEQAITDCFLKLAGRRPVDKELRLLLALRDIELKKFRKDPGKINGWLKPGQYTTSKTMDQAVLAANTVVASTIMNSDASITKR